MGAWGYEVYANDNALDFIWDLQRMPLPDFIVAGIKQGDEYLRVAADLFVTNYSTLESMHDEWTTDTRLELIDKMSELANGEWAKDWDNEEKVRALLEQEIDALERL